MSRESDPIVVIRRPDRAKADDEAIAIRDVMLASRRAALPGLRESHSADEALAFVREVVLATQSVWLAEADGRIVGFAARKDGWLMHLYVAPGWSGCGVGQQLLDRVVAESASLELWTFARNAGARRFYERNGFVAVEFGDGGGNEEGEADVRYVRPRRAARHVAAARMSASRRAPSRSR